MEVRCSKYPVRCLERGEPQGPLRETLREHGKIYLIINNLQARHYKERRKAKAPGRHGNLVVMHSRFAYSIGISYEIAALSRNDIAVNNN